MYLFDYIFYRISRIYLKTKIENVYPELGGGAVTSLFQGFNIITILYFLFSIKMTPDLWVYLWIPLVILNWIFFFNRKNLKKYHQKWDEEEKSKRKIKGLLIIVYMLATLYFFGLALSKMY
jgi:polyferredoxin